MIDNNIFISSATLIPDMYNDYNIQSDDFVSRFPIWVANALEELKFIQAYANVEKDIEFDDHRCQLPWDFRGVIDVIINNKKAIAVLTINTAIAFYYSFSLGSAVTDIHSAFT